MKWRQASAIFIFALVLLSVSRVQRSRSWAARSPSAEDLLARLGDRKIFPLQLSAPAQHPASRKLVTDSACVHLAVGEPPGFLARTGPKYRVNAAKSTRLPAALIALAHNDEADAMARSMRELERTWNSKFNYPWIFFNHVPFSDDFKRITQAATRAPCKYELIPIEHWQIPKKINVTRAINTANSQEQQDGKTSKTGLIVSQKSRWYAGFFYKHPALKDIQYYWRVEPDLHFFCQVDYDVFHFMATRNKTYGFAMTLYSAAESIPTLWPTTQTFVSSNPQQVHGHNSLAWLSDDKFHPDRHRTAGYSTCHFRSSFEIGDLNFWRQEPYNTYFAHLDATGGFFYERWSDAHVHSIGVGLFADSNSIQWFRDIGYQHDHYFHCPRSNKCTGCVADKFTDSWFASDRDDCSPSWILNVGLG